MVMTLQFLKFDFEFKQFERKKVSSKKMMFDQSVCARKNKNSTF